VKATGFSDMALIKFAPDANQRELSPLESGKMLIHPLAIGRKQRPDQSHMPYQEIMIQPLERVSDYAPFTRYD